MKNKIEFTIIIIAFILSMKVYLIIFTFPVFIITISSLWLSKRKLITKILWTIIPLILYYLTIDTISPIVNKLF